MDGTSLIPPTEQTRSQNIPHMRSAILNNSSSNWMKLNRLENWTLEDRSARKEKNDRNDACIFNFRLTHTPLRLTDKAVTP